jgi:hypothetical protein
MTWRFNNRKNPYLFRDTMLKPIHSENLEYKELTKGCINYSITDVIFFPAESSHIVKWNLPLQHHNLDT